MNVLLLSSGKEYSCCHGSGLRACKALYPSEVITPCDICMKKNRYDYLYLSWSMQRIILLSHLHFKEITKIVTALHTSDQMHIRCSERFRQGFISIYC